MDPWLDQWLDGQAALSSSSSSESEKRVLDPSPSEMAKFLQELDEIFPTVGTSPPDLPAQEMPSVPLPNALAPVTFTFPSPIDILRNKLWTMSPNDSLTNEELALVASNIYAFTQEDLLRIPNIYLRGNTHYPLQLAREVMTSLKMVTGMTGMSLHAILPPFLTEAHCNCYCTNKHDRSQCTRKRRIGEVTCSRHLQCVETVAGYVFKMQQTPRM